MDHFCVRSKSLKVHLLSDRSDLLQETAIFINKEWPRSLNARISSLRCPGEENPLPCSFVMTTPTVGMETEEKVIGYARLMPTLEKPSGALIETVLVDPAWRGCGLGRHIMEEAEEHARKMGVVTLHLSTHDKQAFYGHLGYGAGPVVSPRRSCVARLGNEVDFIKDQQDPEQATPTTDSHCQSSCDEDHTHHPATSDDLRISPEKHSSTNSVSPLPPPLLPSPSAPPPAPPPVLPPPPPKLNPSVTTWMMKKLI